MSSVAVKNGLCSRLFCGGLDFDLRSDQSILAIQFRTLGLLAPKTFSIIWLSNLSTLSVPDEVKAIQETRHAQ